MSGIKAGVARLCGSHIGNGGRRVIKVGVAQHGDNKVILPFQPPAITRHGTATRRMLLDDISLPGCIHDGGPAVLARDDVAGVYAVLRSVRGVGDDRPEERPGRERAGLLPVDAPQGGGGFRGPVLAGWTGPYLRARQPHQDGVARARGRHAAGGVEARVPDDVGRDEAGRDQRPDGQERSGGERVDEAPVPRAPLVGLPEHGLGGVVVRRGLHYKGEDLVAVEEAVAVGVDPAPVPRAGDLLPEARLEPPEDGVVLGQLAKLDGAPLARQGAGATGSGEEGDDDAKDFGGVADQLEKIADELVGLVSVQGQAGEGGVIWRSARKRGREREEARGDLVFYSSRCVSCHTVARERNLPP